MIRSTSGRVLATVALGGLLALSACSRSSGGKPAASGGTTTIATAASADFGTMKDVCGPATGTNKATGRGVTATSIDLGTISDAGFPGRPGLNEELWQASDVFVKWCNSLGGISGRTLVDTHLDAALTQYKQQILKACDSAFALVGGGGVLDDSGEKERLKCLLPSFPGFLLTPVARDSQLKWQSVPAPLKAINASGFTRLAKQFPDSVSNVGMLTANVSATVIVGRQVKEAMTQLGLKLGGYDQQYNALGESSWAPFASTIKQKGVKGLMFIGEPENLAKLEQALAAVNYKPEWIGTLPNIYDQSFLKAVGGKAFNTFVPVAAYPFELADKKAPGSEATLKYLSLFARYSPHGKARSGLGVAAFSAWLLFAQAAKPCGADLTPRCLYDNAQKITHFTAGGLIAPTDPASDAGSPCLTAVRAEGDRFTVQDVQPTNGIYNCDPRNVIQLKGNYGRGVTLADVGRSIADLR